MCVVISGRQNEGERDTVGVYFSVRVCVVCVSMCVRLMKKGNCC